MHWWPGRGWEQVRSVWIIKATTTIYPIRICNCVPAAPSRELMELTPTCTHLRVRIHTTSRELCPKYQQILEPMAGIKCSSTTAFTTARPASHLSEEVLPGPVTAAKRSRYRSYRLRGKRQQRSVQMAIRSSSPVGINSRIASWLSKPWIHIAEVTKGSIWGAGVQMSEQMLGRPGEPAVLKAPRLLKSSAEMPIGLLSKRSRMVVKIKQKSTVYTGIIRSI